MYPGSQEEESSDSCLLALRTTLTPPHRYKLPCAKLFDP